MSVAVGDVGYSWSAGVVDVDCSEFADVEAGGVAGFLVCLVELAGAVDGAVDGVGDDRCDADASPALVASRRTVRSGPVRLNSARSTWRLWVALLRRSVE